MSGRHLLNQLLDLLTEEVGQCHASAACEIAKPLLVGVGDAGVDGGVEVESAHCIAPNHERQCSTLVLHVKQKVQLKQ